LLIILDPVVICGSVDGSIAMWYKTQKTVVEEFADAPIISTFMITNEGLPVEVLSDDTIAKIYQSSMDSGVFFTVATSRGVSVHRGIYKEPVSSWRLDESATKSVVSAQQIHYETTSHIVLVCSDGEIHVLGLPRLNVAAHKKFDIPCPLDGNRVFIQPEGRIEVHVGDYQFRHYYLFENQNHHRLPISKPTLHDSALLLPERIIPQTQGRSKWLDTVKKALTSSRWTTTTQWRATNAELESLLIQPVSAERAQNSTKKRSLELSNEIMTTDAVTLTSQAQQNVMEAAKSGNAFGNAAQVSNIHYCLSHVRCRVLSNEARD
jgi:hypothetical protein